MFKDPRFRRDDGKYKERRDDGGGGVGLSQDPRLRRDDGLLKTVWWLKDSRFRGNDVKKMQG